MRRVIVLVFILVVSLTGALRAQTTNASVTGRITDPTKAVIPGTQITLINMGTNLHYEGTTNETGTYYVPDLPPGIYRIEVEKTGFKTVIKPQVILHVQDALEINFEMALGSVSELVTVKAGAPLVQLATSSLGTVVNSTTVRELPLNGRDWTQLAALQPGVSIALEQQRNGVAASRAARGFGTEMSISGTRPQTNNYRLDGISIVDYAGGSPGSVLGVALGVDAIAEFSVLTANQSAEYGRTSGGVINAITRSGTNSFHGDAYEFLRNSSLDSRDFFDANIPPFRRNQFGASAGGPIQKDKTFFFGDYEGLRQAQGITNVDTVPSADARNGILHNADGTTTNIAVAPVVQPYLAFWPLPNAGLLGVGNTGHFDIPVNNISSEDFGTARIDRTFSDKDSISGTWFFDSSSSTAPDNLNSVLEASEGTRQMIALEETHSFSASLVNSLRGGFSRVANISAKSIQAINPLAADTSLGSFPGRDAPQISVSGLSGFSGGLGALSTSDFAWNSFQAYDDAYLTKGDHSLKFGFAFERMQFNEFVPSRPNGLFTFGSLTAFLTNQPKTFAGSPPGTVVLNGIQQPSFTEHGDRQSLFGAYLQDDWRFRPNLTVNLGLRYEAVTVPTEVQNKLVNLRTFTAPYPGHIGSPYFNNPTLLDFEPRAGFAWDPFHDGKTAVRGAFGIFDALPLIYEVSLAQVHSAPFAVQISAGNLLPGSFPTGAASAANVVPSKLVSNSFENSPNRNYVMIWNLNVQHQLTPSTSVTLGYVGNHGVHMLNRADDVNDVLPTATSQGLLWPSPAGSGARMNPTVGEISGLYWGGDSEYDALEAQVTKMMSHGLQLQGSYTWGKNIDTGSASFVGDPFQNSISSLFWFCKTCRRGLSDYNVAQTLVVNYLWDVPTPRNWGSVASHVFGGWELGGIITAETGIPFTPLIGGDPLGLNNVDPYAFPNRLVSPGCGSDVNPGNPINYVKLSCFAPSNPLTLMGNAGRNTVVGPGLADYDFSLIKNNYIKRISENFNVQFRAEFFNVLNRPNFATPVDNETFFSQTGAPIGGAGTLDQIAEPAREIQFALKVIW